MRCGVQYLLLCAFIFLGVYVVVQHLPFARTGDCGQLHHAFDQYADPAYWNFGNYESIPSTWIAASLVDLRRLAPSVYEVTMRGETHEEQFVFIIPAYAANRYRIGEGYTFDIGNYRKRGFAMVDSRYASEVQQSITEPVLVPVRCN